LKGWFEGTLMILISFAECSSVVGGKYNNSGLFKSPSQELSSGFSWKQGFLEAIILIPVASMYKQHT
jgi:hypothetical protein